jgi:hypothetical protein
MVKKLFFIIYSVLVLTTLAVPVKAEDAVPDPCAKLKQVEDMRNSGGLTRVQDADQAKKIEDEARAEMAKQGIKVCGCQLSKTERGVLISHAVTVGGFNCYVYTLLNENMPYVMIIAIVLIIFSGVQYMFAAGTPTAQGTAKQRVFGILGGLLFYFLIRYILKLIAGGLSL